MKGLRMSGRVLPHQVSFILTSTPSLTFLLFTALTSSSEIRKQNPNPTMSDIGNVIINVSYDTTSNKSVNTVIVGHLNSNYHPIQDWIFGRAYKVQTINNSSDGCSRITNVIHESWVAVIQRGDCNFSTKIYYALVENNASAVIIYDNEPNSDYVVMQSDIQNVLAISIKKVDGESLLNFIDKYEKVTILLQVIKLNNVNNMFSGNKTSTIFLFISFIVLAIVSMLWLIFYYVQRFRMHSHINADRARRIRKKMFKIGKSVVSKMEQKTLKLGDPELSGESCAICVEEFVVADVVRILPCKHLFHKKCVDEWLSQHRRCPICQLDIIKAAGIVIPEECESLETIPHINVMRTLAATTAPSAAATTAAAAAASNPPNNHPSANNNSSPHHNDNGLNINMDGLFDFNDGDLGVRNAGSGTLRIHGNMSRLHGNMSRINDNLFRVNDVGSPSSNQINVIILSFRNNNNNKNKNKCGDKKNEKMMMMAGRRGSDGDDENGRVNLGGSDDDGVVSRRNYLSDDNDDGAGAGDSSDNAGDEEDYKSASSKNQGGSFVSVHRAYDGLTDGSANNHNNNNNNDNNNNNVDNNGDDDVTRNLISPNENSGNDKNDIKEVIGEASSDAVNNTDSSNINDTDLVSSMSIDSMTSRTDINNINSDNINNNNNRENSNTTFINNSNVNREEGKSVSSVIDDEEDSTLSTLGKSLLDVYNNNINIDDDINNNNDDDDVISFTHTPVDSINNNSDDNSNIKNVL
ncbi:hypothetical protein HELRODRAFT_194547 [Helobdella robusta]|uniref:RING-type domain-containing protein n=1 Tax=Helobdella robusta TaxID=6412 RepID=T1FW66_HELRO|nr:hypothetical protein HELRODRAFT_194547 [Helobdella robusta]ESN91096.1 hypothetical protein HELRODRAFT_194547 [Helobdella robusta]